MADDPDPSQRHPKSTYKSDYYFNKKTTTESGHEMEWDDTPGHERVRIAHKTGSYIEWSADGRKVESIKNHEHKYVQGGLTQTVENNSDLKFNGNVRTSIGQDSHNEINGDYTQAIAKNLSIAIGKGAAIVVMDDLYIVCKNLTVQTSDNVNFDVGGDFAVNAAGNFNVIAGKGISARADGGDFQTKSSAKTIIDVGSTLDTKSGGTTTVKAPKIDFKSG
jgi:hypothetical protein